MTQCVEGLHFSRAAAPALSRTLLGAIIALRGGLRGYGFGAVCPVCDIENVGPTSNAATDCPVGRCWSRCWFFPSKSTACVGSNAATLFLARVIARMCSHVRVCAIACATVAALLRCCPSLLFLYLPEKKEEKREWPRALPATVPVATVAGAVAAWVSRCFGCETLEKRGI